MPKKKKPQKVVKKTVKDKSSKKTTRRRRKINSVAFDSSTIIDIEQVYKVINRIQLARETLSFAVRTDDSAVVEHILQDLTLLFSSKDVQDAVEFTVSPTPIREGEQDFTHIEEFPDEIPEENKIIF